MPAIIEPPDEAETSGPLSGRLAWFIGLALASAAVTIAAAYLLKALLR